jgi:hypothetical protein
MPFLAPIIAWIVQKAFPWMVHQISRTWGVFLVGAIIVIILMRWGVFKNTLYEKGYKAGYTQAIKDHPSNTVSGSGTVNYYEDKSGWVDWKFLRIFRVILVPDK